MTHCWKYYYWEKSSRVGGKHHTPRAAIIHIERKFHLGQGQRVKLTVDLVCLLRCYVLDELINARKVPGKVARGPSGVEFLVKWRQYTTAESTWEPMEELQKICPEAVEEFMQLYPTHPALRSLKRPRPVSGKATEENPPREPEDRTPDQPTGGKEKEAEVEDRPVAAKYERQMWFYLVHQPRGKGRVSSRWLPQHHFSVKSLRHRRCRTFVQTT